MLAGAVTPADLPEAFDAKLREYLGVEPANVVEGVLQDVHWSDSNFGYFPTYALGNVIAIQLWERATGELGDLDREFERGEFGSLREWLREHVHRWGRAFEPPELLERVGGRAARRRAVPRLSAGEGRGARRPAGVPAALR